MDHYETAAENRQPKIIVRGPLAMAYIVDQEFRDLYPAPKALTRGTIFRELDLPYLGKGGRWDDQ